eukprot:gene18464-biopygen5424
MHLRVYAVETRAGAELAIPGGTCLTWRYAGGVGVGGPAGVKSTTSRNRLPGGATRVPYPALGGCQRAWFPLFFCITMATFGTQVAPACPVPQSYCILIAL